MPYHWRWCMVLSVIVTSICTELLPVSPTCSGLFHLLFIIAVTAGRARYSGHERMLTRRSWRGRTTGLFHINEHQTCIVPDLSRRNWFRFHWYVPHQQAVPRWTSLPAAVIHRRTSSRLRRALVATLSVYVTPAQQTTVCAHECRALPARFAMFIRNFTPTAVRFTAGIDAVSTGNMADKVKLERLKCFTTFQSLWAGFCQPSLILLQVVQPFVINQLLKARRQAFCRRKVRL